MRVEPEFEPQPRWPAIVALLAVGGLYAALPGSLVVLPRGILFAVVCVLLVPTIITHQTGKHDWNSFFGYLINTVVTIALVTSLILLLAALPAHKEQPITLLRSAAALWITNVLVFALWYWRLDAGGPHHRDQGAFHCNGAFLFPQMALSPEDKARLGQQNWTPGFIDYLFLAFNTSTALSPTDAPVLSGWAKVLMMIQALVSLTIIALLAARGVNIL